MKNRKRIEELGLDPTLVERDRQRAIREGRKLTERLAQEKESPPTHKV